MAGDEKNIVIFNSASNPFLKMQTQKNTWVPQSHQALPIKLIKDDVKHVNMGIKSRFALVSGETKNSPHSAVVIFSRMIIF